MKWTDFQMSISTMDKIIAKQAPELASKPMSQWTTEDLIRLEELLDSQGSQDTQREEKRR